MSGPIADVLGLGQEEDQITATVAFFRKPAVAATLGAVTGLFVIGLAKLAIGHPAAQTVIEVVTGKGK